MSTACLLRKLFSELLLPTGCGHVCSVGSSILPQYTKQIQILNVSYLVIYLLSYRGTT